MEKKETGGPETAVGAKLPGDPGDNLSERIAKLTFVMEKMNLAEYTHLLQNPWRLIWVNLLAGSARGLGMGVGFAVLTTVFIYLIHGLMIANLPYIGNFLATIVRLVEHNLRP
jgi:hypothetical protein